MVEFVGLFRLRTESRNRRTVTHVRRGGMCLESVKGSRLIARADRENLSCDHAKKASLHAAIAMDICSANDVNGKFRRNFCG